MTSSIPLPVGVPASASPQHRRRWSACVQRPQSSRLPVSGRRRVCHYAAAAAHDGGAPSDKDVETALLAWLDEFVIELELCPFASAARRGTRVVCCRGEGWPSVQPRLEAELCALDGKPREVQATTLVALLHPMYRSFDAYMDVHSQAEALGQELTPNVQVVPFHPEAMYESDHDSKHPGDAAEYATRSPVPMLHLLRTSDVERAERGWEGPDICDTNAGRLRGLGMARVDGMLARFRRMASR